MKQPSVTALAHQDIAVGIRQFSLAWFLAWEDIRQRYIRTMLGPLWIVLSTGGWFVTLAIVMSNLFNPDLPNYLRYMVCGMLIWTWMASCILESPLILMNSAALIKSFPIPIFTQYLRFILRNFIILLHNSLILIIVFLLYPPHTPIHPWIAIAGLLLNTFIILNVAVCVSLINLRYNDTVFLIMNAMQILPMVTPIFWDRSQLKTHYWIADFNPLYHMLEIIRAPLLGQMPDSLSWLVTTAMAGALLIAAYWGFRLYRHRIIFWL